MIHLHSWKRQKGNETRSLISSSLLSSGEEKHINTSLHSRMVNATVVVCPKSSGSREEGAMNPVGHLGRVHRGDDI